LCHGRATYRVRGRGRSSSPESDCYGRTVNADHVKSRLHDAMHRGHTKVSEEELAEVTVVVLAVVGELAAEMAVLLTELAARVEALEDAKK
jgi:hypothetical protein